jgi:ATP-dependent RNA helicase RhlE
MTINRFNSQSRANKRRPFFNNRSNGGRFKSGVSSQDFSQYINKSIQNVVEEVSMTERLYSDLPVNETLKTNISKKGYTTLTPIQDECIPVIMEGKDVIGLAHTGTGKTAAFLIPLINKVLNDRNEKVLIMVPTRELATQINSELFSLIQSMGLFSVVCIGGQNIESQRRNLSRFHNFLICTPGRLKDLLQRRYVYVSNYNNVVLDEVDRMFDMGFQKDMKIILSELPPVRQTLFFSATLSRNVEELASQYLKNPVRISVNESKISSNIEQDIVRLNGDRTKIEVLHDMLIKEEFSKVLIFGKTKFGVERLSKELRFRGFKAESIHGGKSQSARQNSLNMFKRNYIHILVATDVAARGLDIDNVSHVINYELPESTDDYIHRIGRTGRGSNKGIALTFIN